MLTPEYLLSLAEINPELDEILKKNPPQALSGTADDVPALRATLSEMKRKWNEANAPKGEPWFIEKDIKLTMRDGHAIPARIHSPETPPADGSPLFVMYHGGGFALGGLESEETLCREWAKMGGVALNVDYRLAPEWKFPYAVEDSYDALKWAASHLDELKVNPSKGFIIGGISAGANISAVLAHLYRDDKISPPLTGVWLSIPLIMPSDVVPENVKHLYLARKQNRSAPILNDDSMKLFNDCYQSDPHSPLRGPILFPSHADMPPTYFQVCGMDPLRDDAMIYEEILRTQHGTKTRLDVYPGLPHSFWSQYPTAKFCEKFKTDCTAALEWFLTGEGAPK